MECFPTFTMPSQGFMSGHVFISLVLTSLAAENWFPAVHTLSKLALNSRGEKFSEKSEFPLRKRRPQPLVEFHLVEDREVCFQFAGGRSSSPWRNVGNNTS